MLFFLIESVGPGALIRQGQSTSIEINRKPNRELGIYFIGGNETLLVSACAMCLIGISLKLKLKTVFLYQLIGR